jgi:hypothetical protein
MKKETIQPVVPLNPVVHSGGEVSLWGPFLFPDPDAFGCHKHVIMKVPKGVIEVAEKILLQILDELKEIKADQKEMKQILIDSRTEARSEAKQLAAIQTRQQRGIEMLSSRSVQNEADIKSMQDELEIIKEQLPKT